jgi:hypothetical protein
MMDIDGMYKKSVCLPTFNGTEEKFQIFKAYAKVYKFKHGPHLKQYYSTALCRTGRHNSKHHKHTNTV